ncbi:uncharacterized protein NPIL_244271 [Nephila pilipes]|uniref:Uncharacterized protein n=1 Tax=Nephila pilipes TaxID=299642 RepID=A0A8X6N489_NEPPI|nr:uncharacterized protein NPIL_244271 [Nephila pilipes]
MQNATIKKIIFTQASIELLNIPQNVYSPFKSIEDTLESLEIYDSSSVFAWNISILDSLKKLSTFIIENSEFLEVKAIFEKFTTLKFVQFVNSGVKWIHLRAFKNNKNLTICSLANNYISHVERSIFPKPAVHLWSLDLSFNNIKSLPKDMFDGMPSLHELKLDNNHLKIIPFKVVRPVWNRLTQLWIDDNEVLCWPFCSAIEEKHRPLFLDSSKCSFGGSSEHLLDSLYKYCGKSRKHLHRL